MTNHPENDARAADEAASIRMPRPADRPANDLQASAPDSSGALGASGVPEADIAPGAPATPAAPRSPGGAARSALAGSMRSGVAALVVGVLLLLVMALTPTAYVLRQPGPIFNALGDVVLEEGQDPVPVMTIDGAETYDTGEGQLDVMTVTILGSPRGMPGWVESFMAYVSGERDVLPVEVYYPPGQTEEDRASENETMMQQSQGDAIAAALQHEGYEIDIAVHVAEVAAGGAADGVLHPGDHIVRVDGVDVVDFDSIREALDGNAGTPVPVTIERGGETIDLDLTPTIETPAGEDAPRPLLGIVVAGAYDFPVDVNIQLGDVGGPSAGLIFAMSIVDMLTPEPLTAGHHIAGTGTITAEGDIGPIGGIRQKLYAADHAGAEAFLAPVDNCAEAVDGGVPGDLPVYAVTTLDEGLTAVETIASGGDVGALTTCQEALGP
ncbi:MAG: YlbL family protein [Pseudoclavibacter sp.]